MAHCMGLLFVFKLQETASLRILQDL